MKKLVICLSLIKVFLYYQVSLGFSAPEIKDVTGDVEDGNSIIISGSAFSEKNQAAPLKYEDFEWGSEGMSLDGDVNGGINSYWSTRADQYVPLPDMTIATEKFHSGTRSARADLWNVLDPAGDISDKAWRNNVGFATTGRAFISYWQYIDWGTAKDIPGSGDTFQFKLLYLGDHDEGAASIEPGLYPIIWQHQDYGQGVGYNYSNIVVHRDNNVRINKAPEYTSQHNTIARQPGWYHIVLQVDMGSPGEANGNLKVWISSLEGEAYSYGAANNVMHMEDGESYYDAVRIGWYRGSTSEGGAVHYYDDIYMDNSFARVEIGDADTYEDCRHREIQLANRWADDEITFSVNQGSFKVAEKVYIFVVDKDGSVSPGFGPLTIMAGKTDIQPPYLYPPANS